MARWLFPFVALATIVFVSRDGFAQDAGPPASASATAATVARVELFYNATKSYQSDFTQTFLVKAHNEEKESKGKVTFLKPGKMDFDYVNPAGNRLASDGTVVKIYEAGAKQMVIVPMAKAQVPAALSFLTGQGSLSGTFDFTMFAGAFPNGDVLVGTPKQSTPAFTKVFFYVDSATAQIRRVLIVDGQGNRNRFTFENPKVNIAVDPSRFTFDPPPGTTIVK